MAYRDRLPICPRCGVELVRRQRRDIWRCPRCTGTQLATGELERRVRLLTPDISDDLLGDIMMVRRSRAAVAAQRALAALACPQCLRPMQPVMLGGAHVARCAPDDQLWFDASDLESVVVRAGARHHSQRSWLGRLFAHLFAS